MTDRVAIRQLKDMADMQATVPLQRAVWRMSDVEVASPHTLKAIVHSGGCVIGAEAGGRLIGFCTGFAAIRDGQRLLWSHMAGVEPAQQGRGIGWRLKQAQREWALERGYRLIAWTFDPLQSGNANFNFNRLGISARRYSANHYGVMQDSINAGLASDRLEAQWQLDSPRVVALAAGRAVADPTAWDDVCRLVYDDEDGVLQISDPPALDAERYGIEIPADIAALKERDLARAQAWQLHVREAMTRLLTAGYIVSGFQRGGGKAQYRLSQDD